MEILGYGFHAVKDGKAFSRVSLLEALTVNITNDQKVHLKSRHTACTYNIFSLGVVTISPSKNLCIHGGQVVIAYSFSREWTKKYQGDSREQPGSSSVRRNQTKVDT